MKKRLATTLATVGLTVAAVSVAAPAQADTPCTITNFAPRSVVVGLTPITAKFSVSTSGCTPLGWNVQESNYDFFVYDSSPQETFNPYGNYEAGVKDVIVGAYNSDYTERERVFADSFTLKRRTEWQANTFNASPEPVKKGAPISIAGRLRVADWDTDRYVGYGSRNVWVQFRTPTGSYTTVKTVKSGADGWVRTTVPATTTGIWRFSYGGNSGAGASVTVEDYVQVTG